MNQQFKKTSKPKPDIQPNYFAAIIAGSQIASMYPGEIVEARHCLYCGNYFHVMIGRTPEDCDICSSLNFEVVSKSKS